MPKIIFHGPFQNIFKTSLKCCDQNVFDAAFLKCNLWNIGTGQKTTTSFILVGP